MRRAYLYSTIFLCSVAFLFSCTVSRNQIPSRIGLISLDAYSLVDNNLALDTSYLAIQDEAVFTNTFTGPAKLDLSGKTAVAIVVKNSASLVFDSAAYIGSNINVYAQSCSAATQSKCSTGKVFLATVPKVGGAKTVHFFIDNNRRGSVQL